MWPDITIKFFTACASEVINDEIGHHGGAPLPPPDHDAPQPVTPPPEEQEELVALKFASPLEDDEERLDAFHDGTPIRYRHINNIIGDEPVPEQAKWILVLPW
jgi:hypothetical protein